MILASAHPNVALIKYWGKSHDALRIPATPSLSIPLLALTTQTRIEPATASDQILIAGKPEASGRVARWLHCLRQDFALDIPPLKVDSQNNFPTSAGLASSASGFAALTLAINEMLELHLDQPALSRLARLGSASAARSVDTGFMVLDGHTNTHHAWSARKVLDRDLWPLGVSVAICSRDEKSMSSAEGMRLGRDTSNAYGDWISANQRLFDQALRAVTERDFDALAAASRASFFGMLSVMRSTQPPLNYLTAASHAVINAVGELHDQGIPAFFTCDAGPQVKCVHLAEYSALVCARLRRVPGVLEVLEACP